MPLTIRRSTLRGWSRHARAAVVALVLLSTGGCVSSTVPPELSVAEARRWSETRLNEVVAVEPSSIPVYSDDLVSALRDTHLFTAVERVGDGKVSPTLIARVEEQYNGGVATIPVWTFLTLGVVPTVVKEGSGYHFSLRRPGGSSPPIYVDYKFRSTDTLGWIALIELFSPDVEWASPERSDRFHGRLALAILDQIRQTNR